ncbi:helix-turn-helix domain-containing protein [Alteromonas pelagimontana]|nr:helix-turn-helix domain-containing protein [Alteromonas pelagimontana]
MKRSGMLRKAIASPTIINATDKVVPATPIVKAIIDVARARGAHLEKLLRGTGLFLEDISEHAGISPTQLSRLMINAQNMTTGHDCAFQAGSSLASSHYQGLFVGISTCRHLMDVLRLAGIYRWSLSPFISATRYESATQYYFVLQDSMGASKHWRFAVEMFCAALVAMSKHWHGQRLPFHFDFPFSRPRYIQEFETHLGYRLSFDQPMLVVRLDKVAAYSPFKSVQPHMRRTLLAKYREQRSGGMTLPDSVRFLVKKYPAISLDDVARRLSLSPATVKRRLREYEVTFRQLVDASKREQAIYLLSVQKLSNEQSALKMAISDLTNFRRAVKRWTGFTPSELRNP